MKQRVAVWLCVALLAAVMPWSGVAVAVAEVTEATKMSVAQLMEKYPHGAYWNHTAGGAEDYTWTPCTHHRSGCTYNGSCGCNTYGGKAIQCMGFAYQVASLAYDCDPRGEWIEYRTASALDTLKAGDIVRYNYNGHSIFVTAVEGDTVTYADANGDGGCQILWNRTTTKAKLRNGFTYVKAAPYELPAPAVQPLVVDASAKTVQVGETVTISLTYNGDEQPIAALMGTLRYDHTLYAYQSFSGADVEIRHTEGEIRYVYYATGEQAPTTVEMAFAFAAVGNGQGKFAVETQEFVSDTDYSSLGAPSVSVAVTATTPTLTVRYHGGGGAIDNPVVGHTYRVTSDNGLNMRKDAGTSYGKVTALPYNTLFSVAVGDTKEADGYTWGKTTYNGMTGWLVISDFVEPISPILGGAWILEDGQVCHADGTLLTHRFDYGVALEGLCDPAEVGLYRDGYRFGGWNTAADGSGVAYADGMTAQELCPDGGDTVTLYAVWNPIVPGDADGNGRLNNKDLGLLQRYLNGWDITLCPEADMNGDGAVNNKDLGLLQRALNT